MAGARRGPGRAGARGGLAPLLCALLSAALLGQARGARALSAEAGLTQLGARRRRVSPPRAPPPPLAPPPSLRRPTRNADRARAGQGLKLDRPDAGALKADSTGKRTLAQAYAEAAAGLKAAALLAKSAPAAVKCGGSGGSLCAASPELRAAPGAVLNMTASPGDYDARNPAHTGGVRAAVLEARDQGRCGACVAFALGAAAEAAVATALRRDAAPLSTSDLFFCAGGGKYRRCQDGWRLQDALEVGCGPVGVGALGGQVQWEGWRGRPPGRVRFSLAAAALPNRS
jgi:hypothetical protein